MVLPRGGEDSVGGIGFRRSSLTALSAGLAVAGKAVPVFSEGHLEDRVFLGGGFPSPLGGFSWR